MKKFIPKSWVKYRFKDFTNTFYNDFTERWALKVWMHWIEWVVSGTEWDDTLKYSVLTPSSGFSEDPNDAKTEDEIIKLHTTAHNLSV